MDKARIVKVRSPEPFSDADRDFIRGFLRTSDSEEFSFTVNEDTLEVRLVCLDFYRFKERVANLESEGQAGASQAPANAVAAVQNLFNKIEAIRSYGIRGGKRLYSGYADERKVKGRKAKAAERSPYFYAVESGFSMANSELPPSATDSIVCADSLEFLPTLPDNCVDLIFTSPPYNFGLDYASRKDAEHWQAYFDKLFAIFDECVRVLKFGGRIVVNVQPLFSDYIPSHHLISNHFMRRKMIWKGEILWEKNNYNCKYTAWGSWCSPSSPYLKYTWEFLEVFAKGTLKKGGRSEDADISADEFKEWVVSRWSIAPERKMKSFGHPAMFPEELAYRVLKLFSFRGDIVLDPFNGVGTTTLVAKKLARKYIGVDISPDYCETAERRVGSILL